jgi:nucleoside-diphosphate-sugar epimerase
MGHELAARLLAGGHDVTLLNRGRTPDPFGGRVQRLRGDRTGADFAQLLAGRTFDAAVDFAAFRGADARGAVEALAGRAGHYVMISTGQVYLVREGSPRPARESDYDGPVMPAPPEGHPDRADWEYGVGKRACEDVLAEAWTDRRFPATRLRIPVVYGERDHTRRLEAYLWRLFEGGPLLLPAGGTQTVRHVYAGEVARFLIAILARESTFGAAYNLCQQETPTLAEYVRLLAELMGAPAELVPVPAETLGAAGLDVIAASPFSGRWVSFLDPSRARDELGFVHRPLERCLHSVVASFLAHPPPDRPAGFAQRPRELQLARGLGDRRRA